MEGEYTIHLGYYLESLRILNKIRNRLMYVHTFVEIGAEYGSTLLALLPLNLCDRYILYEVDNKFAKSQDILNHIDGVEYRLYAPPEDELMSYNGFLWMDCEGCEYGYNIEKLIDHYKQSVIAFHIFNDEQIKKLYKLQDKLSECTLVYITPDAKELTFFCQGREVD
jgi:hypothetical protein